MRRWVGACPKFVGVVMSMTCLGIGARASCFVSRGRERGMGRARAPGEWVEKFGWANGRRVRCGAGMEWEGTGYARDENAARMKRDWVRRVRVEELGVVNLWVSWRGVVREGGMGWK